MKDEADRFQRFEETHFQKCYDLDKIKQLLLEAGLEFVAMYDAYTNEPVSEESEKVLFVARECMKTPK